MISGTISSNYGHIDQGQRSLGSRSWVRVKGHVGQGQRSRGSRLNIKLVKPCLKVLILAGGLTSTSSCIFFISFSPGLLLHISDKEIYLCVTYPYKEV